MQTIKGYMTAKDLDRFKVVYTTYMINNVQRRLNLTKEDITCKLYLDALLFEKPIVHFGFILGSFKTASIFLERPELISERIVTVSSEYENLDETLRWIIYDKFEKKRKELNSVGLNYSKDEHMRLELFADKTDFSNETRVELATVITDMMISNNVDILAFEAQEAVDVFKSSLMYNLNIKGNKHNKSRNPALNLLREITEKGSYFEPFWTDYLINKLASFRNIHLEKEDLRVCQDFVEASYFLAGASQIKGDISADFRLYDEFLNRFANIAFKVNRSAEIFKEVFRIYGFDPLSIANLSIDSLKRLRKDPLIYALRKNMASLGKALDAESQELLNELKQVIDAEEKRKRKISLAKYSLKGVLYITDFLTQIPALSDIGDLLIDRIAKRYGDIPISLFFTDVYPKVIQPKVRIKISEA